MARLTNHPRMAYNEWSFDELVNAYSIDPHQACANYARVCLIDEGGSWYGGLNNTSQATALLRDGWKDGSDRLTDLVREVSPPVAKSRRRKPTWSDQGDELSIDRAMAGQWDSAWRTSKRTWTTGPQNITLLTTWGGAAGMSAEQLFWQGAAAAVITDALEGAGYGVRIVAGFSVRCRNQASPGTDGCFTTTVVIKEDTEPMRLDGLAAALCHAGIWRTHGFRAMIASPHDLSSSLGSPMGGFGNEDVQQRLKAAGEWSDDSIVIGAVNDRTSCLYAIESALASLA